MLIRSAIGSICTRLFIVALVTLGALNTAFAHAIITDSVPAVGSTIAGPDVDIKLTYNSRIDLTRSRLQLFLSDGSKQDLAISADSTAATVISKAGGLAPGAYRLRWQVLSVDGHITRGDIPFTVKAD